MRVFLKRALEGHEKPLIDRGSCKVVVVLVLLKVWALRLRVWQVMRRVLM